jgi:hypothetical protein
MIKLLSLGTISDEEAFNMAKNKLTNADFAGMSAEDRKKAHDRRKAKDRERRGLIGEIRTPQTPEQKRAKEAEKKRLQYFRKKSLT